MDFRAPRGRADMGRVGLDHPGWGNLMDAVADVFGYDGRHTDLWVHPHEQGGHSPLYLRMIHLMRYEGASLGQIAAVMGVTVQSVWLSLRKPVCCADDATSAVA